MGLQQLGPGGFRVHGQPTHAAAGEQLSAEQGGGEHRLRTAVLHGGAGQRRGNVYARFVLVWIGEMLCWYFGGRKNTGSPHNEWRGAVVEMTHQLLVLCWTAAQ